MLYFAEINPETNVVLRVVITQSKAWCDYHYGGIWIQTYKSTPGKNRAIPGYIYHVDKDNFSAPQPYPSWTLDDQCIWQPPVTRPEDDNLYNWNEETQSWDETKAL